MLRVSPQKIQNRVQRSPPSRQPQRYPSALARPLAHSPRLPAAGPPRELERPSAFASRPVPRPPPAAPVLLRAPGGRGFPRAAPRRAHGLSGPSRARARHGCAIERAWEPLAVPSLRLLAARRACAPSRSLAPTGTDHPGRSTVYIAAEFELGRRCVAIAHHAATPPPPRPTPRVRRRRDPAAARAQRALGSSRAARPASLDPAPRSASRSRAFRRPRVRGRRRTRPGARASRPSPGVSLSARVRA